MIVKELEMNLANQIKASRKKVFLTQEEYANELGVSISTIIRWEMGQYRPNLAAMKKIKAFCEKNKLSFDEIEKAWLEH